MSWVALLRGLLTLANFVASRIRDERLMDAGEARLALKQLEDLNDRIAKAAAARADEPDPDELRVNDGYRRD